MPANQHLTANRFLALVLTLFILFPAWSAWTAPQSSAKNSAGKNAVQAAEEGSPLFTQAQRSADRDGYTLITTPELLRMMDENPNLLLVDVRFSYEFVSGHMPEAVSLPVDLRDRGDLPKERRQAMLDTFGPDKDRPIVVYCRDFR